MDHMSLVIKWSSVALGAVLVGAVAVAIIGKTKGVAR